jgi:hypothetical protein
MSRYDRAGGAHALDLSGLRAPDIAFWTGWDGETLVVVVALKALSADHGEVKSMHALTLDLTGRCSLRGGAAHNQDSKAPPVPSK